MRRTPASGRPSASHGSPSGSVATSWQTARLRSFNVGLSSGVQTGGWLAVSGDDGRTRRARCAVCVLADDRHGARPDAAVRETEMFATKLVGDSTVVALTVMPAPNVARVLPATNADVRRARDPHVQVVRADGRRRHLGQEMSMTSSDFPVLASPVGLLRTLSAAVPIGRPAGTVTVRRRKSRGRAQRRHCAGRGGRPHAPDAGVNVTSLLAAVALKPVPVIEIATDGDAPIGLTSRQRAAEGGVRGDSR